MISQCKPRFVPHLITSMYSTQMQQMEQEQDVDYSNVDWQQVIQQINDDHQQQQNMTRPRMENISLEQQDGDCSVNIDWSDGERSVFPSVYLRDNCNDYKAPSGHRLFETYQLTDDQTKIDECSLDDYNESISIRWSDTSYNVFSAEWLYTNSCNKVHRQQKAQQLASNLTLWDNQMFELNETCKFSEIEQHESQIEIYRQLREFGVCLVRSAPVTENYDSLNDPPVVNVGNFLGFVRSTNYGKYFDVRSMSNSNHLAYTSVGLSVHTDNPYRNPTPGIQLLHCLKQAPITKNNDGFSTLVDGFRIAQEMKEKHPKEFELLATIKRPFYYSDMKSGYVFHHKQAVIGVDSRGMVESIHYNNRGASSLDWDIDESLIAPYYEAWKLFGKMVNDAERQYTLEFRLEPGDILIFNNNRVLHGRNGYDDDGANDGEITRHLQGCYIDCDTVWARLAASEHVHC